MNRFGWMLVKDRFWESYETNRLIEEFQKQDIDIQLVDPNTIDIFVNKENRQSILVNGKSLPLPKFVFPRTGSGTTYHIKAVIRHFERMGVVVINNSDVCKSAASAAIQTQILGFASGITVTDENCERLKLARSTYGMGMKVAAVSLLCQDARVFDAMWMAGTPCPYKGSIGDEAKTAWEKNPEDVPSDSKVFKKKESKG